MALPNLQDVTSAAECPTMACRYALTEGRDYAADKVLIASFSGEYRPGSQGNPDAAYMRGMVFLGCELWWHRGLVIDLSEVQYEWGDMIGSALEHPQGERVAIVVGPGCEEALGTLFFGMHTQRSVTELDGYFRDLAEAIADVRARIPDL